MGIIRGSHGLKGNCKIESTSGEYEHGADLKDVTLRKNGIEKKQIVDSVKSDCRFSKIKKKAKRVFC